MEKARITGLGLAFMAALLLCNASLASAAAQPITSGVVAEIDLDSPIVVPEPEPTVDPEPEPTDEPVEPEPLPTEVPVDPGEPEVPVPAPEQPVEAPQPEESVPDVTDEGPADEVDQNEFSDDLDSEEQIPVAPVETPTPTPTPTPIPAVDIFAPFYPPSSGAARDSMPLVFGGAAVGLVVLAAIISFVLARVRLARMRTMAHVDVERDRSKGAASATTREPLPTKLDISSLTGGATAANAVVADDRTSAYHLDLPDKGAQVRPTAAPGQFRFPGASTAPRRPQVSTEAHFGSLSKLLGVRVVRVITDVRTDLTGIMPARPDASVESTKFEIPEVGAVRKRKARLAASDSRFLLPATTVTRPS
ncbi:hypothetical protein N1031_17250 [Herbiconiux moechotypicola]|uniref:Uncharacterized protein n=1 Tax=Herbiconiux moechotypicola TaxID=637393 RepID=A0ABN3DR50_9MICO|nr:hypothetical protein [Herbiconiux moechotypicola]MCS5731511.1 hypothetical protein [Herbiconiux moechotypicola]